jgi:hypothetical protein
VRGDPSSGRSGREGDSRNWTYVTKGYGESVSTHLHDTLEPHTLPRPAPLARNTRARGWGIALLVSLGLWALIVAGVAQLFAL